MSKDLEVKKANMALHRETALFFEERNLELFNRFEQHSLDERIRKADQTCKRHIICCDIACGTGNVIRKQIPRFGNVVGLDISREMIEVCKAKGLGNKAHFVIGDAENLPFRNDLFDIVTMHAALHHVPSVPKCFKEIYRVLPKEGIMYIDHEPNSKHIRDSLNKVKIFPKLIIDVRAKKQRTSQSLISSLFPSEYKLADFHESEGFTGREIRKRLESIGFLVTRTSGHHTFFSYLYRLPTPLNSLSFIDNLLDSLPVVRHLSSHICIWAKK
jgi:ubiquinone/menaquinone biosynthesis C-methylase UbiE